MPWSRNERRRSCRTFGLVRPQGFIRPITHIKHDVSIHGWGTPAGELSINLEKMLFNITLDNKYSCLYKYILNGYSIKKYIWILFKVWNRICKLTFTKLHLNCTEHWLVQEENHFRCKIFICVHILCINTNLSPYGKSIQEIIDTWFHFGFHSFHVSIYSCCISLIWIFWWFFIFNRFWCNNDNILKDLCHDSISKICFSN